MDYLGTILAIALPQIPYFLVDVVGLIIAIVRRKRHPKVSLLAGIYFAGRFIMSLIGIGTSTMPLYMTDLGFGVSDLGIIMSVVGLFNVTIGTILSVILLFALFGWREEKQPIAIGVEIKQ